MSRLYIFILVLPFLLCGKQVSACGYDFVGGCSTDLALKINGTNGVFAIAPCNFEVPFDGLYLGRVRSLALSQVRSITWESCINNVSAVQFRYRLYEQSQTPGSFNSLNLPEAYSTLQGPYTTRYRQANVDILLTNGLTVGKIYTLEVYYYAEVDTLGDDFIPETTMLQNNSGANYKLSFEYGGATAPQLLPVLIRKDNILCNGQSNGAIGIRVFGVDSTASLFYQWSSNTQNFFQITNLTANTYTVTVTETPTGNTASLTTIISQPAPLSSQLIQQVGLNCTGNTTGLLVVSGNGGTMPYHYNWSNGSTSDSLQSSVAGTYGVTVIDNNGCTNGSNYELPATGTAQVNIAASFCSGSVYTAGGQSFSQSGQYSFYSTSTAGCDTLYHLTLSAIDPSAVLAALPTDTSITCTSPQIQLCGITANNAAFMWQKNGIVVSTTPCVVIQSGGVYQITATLNSTQGICTATRLIEVSAYQTPVPVSASGTATFLQPCVSGDSILVSASAIPEGAVAAFNWTYGGVTIANTASCIATLPATAAIQGYPNGFRLETIDQHGCLYMTFPDIQIEQAEGFPVVQQIYQHTLCDGEVSVTVNVQGGQSPYTFEWSGLGFQSNPAAVAPGLYFITVRDNKGCATEVATIVEEFYISTGSIDASGPASADGSAYVNTGGAINLPYSAQWSNGMSGGQIFNLLPGTYCVTVTDAAGCTRTACVTVKYTVPVTQPYDPDRCLHIRPTVTTTGSDLYVDLPSDEWLLDWQLVDYGGRVVDRSNIDRTELSIHLSEKLMPGMYILIANTNKMVRSGKIFLTN